MDVRTETIVFEIPNSQEGKGKESGTSACPKLKQMFMLELALINLMASLLLPFPDEESIMKKILKPKSCHDDLSLLSLGGR